MHGVFLNVQYANEMNGTSIYSDETREDVIYSDEINFKVKET